MHKRVLTFEHARHVSAQWLYANEHKTKEQSNLQNSDASHGFLSEPLRTEQSVNQINEQTERCDAGNDVIHKFFLKLVTGLREGPENEQNQATYSDIEKIEHATLLRFRKNDFMAHTLQFSGQTLLRCWPPSSATTENDDGMRLQHPRKGL
jgi:hypothetical protein